MTISVVGSGWHIEYFRQTHSNIPTATTDDVTINLEKPGRLLWMTDAFTSTSLADIIVTILDDVGGTGVGFFGQAIATFISRFRNDSGVNATARHMIAVCIQD